MKLPDFVEGESQLEDLLSYPYPETVEAVKGLGGDIVVLGAGGKIGPSLVATAVRAVREAGASSRVIAVSRFSKREVKERISELGAEVVEADLSKRDEVESLPAARNVVFMVGRKFGTSEEPGLTWVTNVYVPSLVAERYEGSNFAVFSTGNVYPLLPLSSGGATESTPPSPVGEYGWSALARERVFSHYVRAGRGKLAILRLNYACELRYGVLVDIAEKVWRGEEVDLSMGAVNAIWQGDVNNLALMSLALASNPPTVINVTGPETASVRWIATELGRLMGREPKFRGQEGSTALLSNASEAFRLFGYPRVPLATMLRWEARWVSSGKRTYGLPTHYEVREETF